MMELPGRLRFVHIFLVLTLSPGLYASEAPPAPGTEGSRQPSIAATFSPAGRGGPGTTYLVDIDNEDNAGSGNADGDMGGPTPAVIYDDNPLHPIEFNFNVSGALPITSAKLVIEAYDVDETGGQVDQVLFNGNPVGFLTGANEQWSTTLLSIPIELVQAGKNTVKLLIDENPPGQNGIWWVQIGSGQLLIDGGAVSTASVRSISTDKPVYSYGDSVVIITEVDTSLVSQNIRVESNILTADLTNIAGKSTTTTISAGSDDAVQVVMQLPIGGDGGAHTIESLVFDNDTGFLEVRHTVPLEIRSMCNRLEDLSQPLPISGVHNAWYTSDEGVFDWEALANTADSGTLTALPGRLIASVSFWGVSAEVENNVIVAECLDTSKTPFNFYFYADNGGAPGTLLASRLDIQAPSTHSGSCCTSPGDLSAYRFDAEFDDPISTDGVRWISIRRQGKSTPAGNPCIFGWLAESDTTKYDNTFTQRHMSNPEVNVREGVQKDLLLCVNASLTFRNGFESNQ